MSDLWPFGDLREARDSPDDDFWGGSRGAASRLWTVFPGMSATTTPLTPAFSSRLASGPRSRGRISPYSTSLRTAWIWFGGPATLVIEVFLILGHLSALPTLFSRSSGRSVSSSRLSSPRIRHIRHLRDPHGPCLWPCKFGGLRSS